MRPRKPRPLRRLHGDTLTKKLKRSLGLKPKKSIWSQIGFQKWFSGEHSRLSQDSPDLKPKKSIWSGIGFQKWFSAERSRLSQHFGRKARIPDLFERRDQVYLALEAQRLQWHIPPPSVYHDLLDAAARVGRIEERMGYTFRNKMLCIEALKVTMPLAPLYFKGVVHHIDRNNRLALLGDRALGLALCDVWFQTGNTTTEYSRMSVGTESRAVLSTKGHALGIQDNLLMYKTHVPTANIVAEAFEAVFGAIYVDSGNSIEAVKKVITGIELDNHELLKSVLKPQDRLDQKRLAVQRHSEMFPTPKVRQQIKTIAPAANKAKRVAEPVRKQAVEQPEEEVQEDDTSTERQTQNGISETTQSQTTDKSNVVPTHAESLFRLISYGRQATRESLRMTRKPLRSQTPNEPPPQDSDQARDARMRRRAVAAAYKLTKEGDLLSDVMERDGTAIASEQQQNSPVSRINDQDNVESQLKLDSKITKSSPPADSEAEVQPPQNNAVTTAPTKENESNAPTEANEPDAPKEFPVEVEQYVGFTPGEIDIMKRAWNAASLSDSKEKGEDFDDTYGRILTEELSKGGKGGKSQRSARRLLRMSRKARRQAKDLFPRATKRDREEPKEMQHRDDPEVSIKPRKETTQAISGLLLEPPTTTVTKADHTPETVDPLPETAGPTSTTSQQKKSPALKSGEANTVTSTVPVPVADQGDNDKKIQVRTKDVGSLESENLKSHEDTWQSASTTDVEVLEGEILESHNDIWQSAGAADASLSRQRTIRTARARRPSKLKVSFKFFESNTDRLVAITQDDVRAPKAPQAPKSNTQRKKEMHFPSPAKRKKLGLPPAKTQPIRRKLR